jgi:hypothetical protein
MIAMKEPAKCLILFTDFFARDSVISGTAMKPIMANGGMFVCVVEPFGSM